MRACVGEQWEKLLNGWAHREFTQSHTHTHARLSSDFVSINIFIAHGKVKVEENESMKIYTDVHKHTPTCTSLLPTHLLLWRELLFYLLPGKWKFKWVNSPTHLVCKFVVLVGSLPILINVKNSNLFKLYVEEINASEDIHSRSFVLASCMWSGVQMDFFQSGLIGWSEGLQMKLSLNCTCTFLQRRASP